MIKKGANEKRIRFSFSLSSSSARVIRSIPPSFRSEFIDWVIEHRDKGLDSEFVKLVREKTSFDFF